MSAFMVLVQNMINDSDFQIRYNIFRKLKKDRAKV